ncbi:MULTISPECIES: hypothetical protein [Agrobacterium]|uniref:DNA-binding protein n=1 Tax=Agrobacterium tumefaciens TaxID=358 RepID=A0AAE6BID9_AGRTU|nr:MULTISPECIES: hypothetical protein [Agrobacterium]QCL77082.1 hypothetical protein CFBP5499_26900 [Agrobacterium tumefaciens]QCL82590.1 hypothetical protein CFBP5877_26150 [Agrobacterium tumefaciens]CUX70041.1 hypothetical protein AGR6A_pAt20019 [Agrobacterium sp. NCPPB 925]
MTTILETEILTNMALVMEQERIERWMTTTELLKLCELSESNYLGIFDGSVKLRLSAVVGTGRNLDIPLVELFGRPSVRFNRHH